MSNEINSPITSRVVIYCNSGMDRFRLEYSFPVTAGITVKELSDHILINLSTQLDKKIKEKGIPDFHWDYRWEVHNG